MILNCSIPISIGELNSVHGIGVLSVKSLCYQQMIDFPPRVDLFVGDPLEVFKGVTILEF